MSEDVQMEIAEHRGKIDEIDCRIVELLNDRARLALKIRDLKPAASMSLYDPKREEEIFANLAACSQGPLFDDNLREIYGTILQVMKEM
jgi:chorismate mutase